MVLVPLAPRGPAPWPNPATPTCLSRARCSTPPRRSASTMPLRPLEYEDTTKLSPAARREEAREPGTKEGRRREVSPAGAALKMPRHQARPPHLREAWGAGLQLGSRSRGGMGWGPTRSRRPSRNVPPPDGTRAERTSGSRLGVPAGSPPHPAPLTFRALSPLEGCSGCGAPEGGRERGKGQ